MSTLVDIVSEGFAGQDPALDAQHAVLGAIERELARLEPEYANNVLRLAEAYAWLTGTARRLD